MTDELSISVHGQRLAGWTSVRVARGVERVPSSFDISLTERFPASPDFAITAGDPVTVYLGDTLVLTGYVDQYTVSLSADSHQVTIRGRSKVEDLVDCSAGFTKSGPWNGGIVSETTAYQLATDYAASFGITVNNLAGTDGTTLAGTGFYVNLGETAYEVIERVSRFAGFLTYDDVNGNLVLASVGQSRMASGLVEGENVQSATTMFGMNQRYSDYFAVWQAVNSQADMGTSNQYGHATDSGVQARGRFRPLGIVSEQTYMGQPIGQKRAQWEDNRRWGRSHAVRVVTDSWRDGAGNLWQPNAYVPLDIPSCKITGDDIPKAAGQRTGTSTLGKGWIISEVTYSRSLGQGTTAELVIMPDVAFSIEPIVLSMMEVDQQQAIADANRVAGP